MSDLVHSPSEELEIFEEAAGTSLESMLITTDSFEEFSQELSASLDDENSTTSATRIKSNINEIQGKMDESASLAVNKDTTASTVSIASKSTVGSEFGSQELLKDGDQSVNEGGVGSGDESSAIDDYLHDPDWLNKREHVFVLSSAGKPIHSLHGNEDKLATLFGVMQALVSVVHANQDSILSIHADGIKFVFLVKGPLILVAASRRNLSVQQIQLQLT